MDVIFTIITCVIYALGAMAVIGLILYYFRGGLSKSTKGRTENGTHAAAPTEGANSSGNPPKVSFADSTPPAKPRVGLKLDDVNDPPPRPASTQKPTTSTTPPPAANPQAKPNVTESSQSSPSAAPGDFEKALAQAGQRMDALLRQTEELTRSFKLAEKAKMDAQVELNKATTELTRQLGLKDDQIAKLDSQLDRKSTFPSLRALIEVKKLCLDMLNTQKEIPREQLVNFVTAEIDSQLANLEVQLVEFPVGTPLEKIPGDQVETDRRQEPTDDPAKNNQVARLLRPCYFLERDTKRIVVAKALVILYRYNAPSSAPEATPSTPTA
jgi:flagellar hook-basal body complex protein FliE